MVWVDLDVLLKERTVVKASSSDEVDVGEDVVTLSSAPPLAPGLSRTRTKRRFGRLQRERGG